MRNHKTFLNNVTSSHFEFYLVKFRKSCKERYKLIVPFVQGQIYEQYTMQLRKKYLHYSMLEFHSTGMKRIWAWQGNDAVFTILMGLSSMVGRVSSDHAKKCRVHTQKFIIDLTRESGTLTSKIYNEKPVPGRI
jgi:hypothetical protein